MKRNAKGSAGFRSAFTLVELLVVIAIISVLASMLLPVMAEARNRARASVCGSNLKQMGQVSQQYVDENDGFFCLYTEVIPAISGSTSASINWSSRLRLLGYTGPVDYAAVKNKPSFMVCPTAPPEVYAHTAQTYGVWAGMRLDVEHVDNPAKSMWVVDSMDLTGGALNVQSYYVQRDSTSNGQPFIHTRHQNGANMVFFDGHVERMDPSTVFNSLWGADSQIWINKRKLGWGFNVVTEGGALITH